MLVYMHSRRDLLRNAYNTRRDLCCMSRRDSGPYKSPEFRKECDECPPVL